MNWLEWKDQYSKYSAQYAKLHLELSSRDSLKLGKTSSPSTIAPDASLQVCKEVMRWLVIPRKEPRESDISLWFMNEMTRQTEFLVEQLTADSRSIRQELDLTIQEFPDIERTVDVLASLVHVDSDRLATKPLKAEKEPAANHKGPTWRQEVLARRKSEVKEFLDTQRGQKIDRDRTRRVNSAVKRLIEVHRSEREFCKSEQDRMVSIQRRRDKRDRLRRFSESGTEIRIKEHEARFLSKRKRHQPKLKQRPPQIELSPPRDPPEQCEESRHIARKSSIDAIWRRIKDINSVALRIRE